MKYITIMIHSSIHIFYYVVDKGCWLFSYDTN